MPHAENAERLIAWFDDHPKVAVAFSGGVDSSVVLAAALKAKHAAIDDAVIAITARSPSVASWQLDTARQVARELGARHLEIETDEVTLPAYQANDSQRCYHCKSTLYEALQCIVQANVGDDSATVVSGTNHDDLGDYRPGIVAGNEAQVATPLADLKLGKKQVRELARLWELSNAELPASPCLASRIAYGVAVTVERLSMVEQAETLLQNYGLRDFRVRLHESQLARIEVPVDQIEMFCQSAIQDQLVQELTQIGFRYVTVDLAGFRSGNLNSALVAIELPASS